MSDEGNIVDFEAGKLSLVQKKKEMRADQMRKAFREARAESSPKPKLTSLKRRRKKPPKSK